MTFWHWLLKYQEAPSPTVAITTISQSLTTGDSYLIRLKFTEDNVTQVMSQAWKKERENEAQV